MCCHFYSITQFFHILKYRMLEKKTARTWLSKINRIKVRFANFLELRFSNNEHFSNQISKTRFLEWFAINVLNQRIQISLETFF